MLHQLFKARNILKDREKVSYITDEFRETISGFEASVSSSVRYKIASQPVNIDDTIMCISCKE